MMEPGMESRGNVRLRDRGDVSSSPGRFHRADNEYTSSSIGAEHSSGFGELSRSIVTGFVEGSKCVFSAVSALGSYITDKLSGHGLQTTPSNIASGAVVDYYLVRKGQKRSLDDKDELSAKRRPSSLSTPGGVSVGDSWSSPSRNGQDQDDLNLPRRSGVFQMPFRGATQADAIVQDRARYSAPNSPFRRPAYPSVERQKRGSRSSANVSPASSPQHFLRNLPVLSSTRIERDTQNSAPETADRDVATAPASLSVHEELDNEFGRDEDNQVLDESVLDSTLDMSQTTEEMGSSSDKENDQSHPTLATEEEENSQDSVYSDPESNLVDDDDDDVENADDDDENPESDQDEIEEVVEDLSVAKNCGKVPAENLESSVDGQAGAVTGNNGNDDGEHEDLVSQFGTKLADMDPAVLTQQFLESTNLGDFSEFFTFNGPSASDAHGGEGSECNSSAIAVSSTVTPYYADDSASGDNIGEENVNGEGDEQEVDNGEEDGEADGEQYDEDNENDVDGELNDYSDESDEEQEAARVTKKYASVIEKDDDDSDIICEGMYVPGIDEDGSDEGQQSTPNGL